MKINSKKNISLLILAITISTKVFSQEGYSTVLESDGGLRTIPIDSDKENIEKALIEETKVIENPHLCEYAYTVDPKEVKQETYFGLKVREIFVEFSEYEGKSTVKAVTLILELPANEKEEKNFLNAVADHYGEPGRFFDMRSDEPKILRWDWWSDSYLLNIFTGLNFKTWEQEDFFRVIYMSGISG